MNIPRVRMDGVTAPKVPDAPATPRPARTVTPSATEAFTPAVGVPSSPALRGKEVQASTGARAEALTYVREAARDFNPSVRGKFFDASVECPNFLLPAELRELPANARPSLVRARAQAVEQARVELEKTFQSKLQRLALPLAESGTVRRVPFLETLTAQMRKVDPGAQLFPSAGVIRSLFASIYSEVYRGMCEEPPRPAFETLRRLQAETYEVLPLEVGGVGSDWDFFFTTPNGKQAELRALGKKLTESAAAAFGKTALVRKNGSAIPIGDFRELGTQLSRKMAEGGNTLDALSFNVATGKFVEPEPGLVDQLVAGEWEFRPSDPELERDLDTRTVAAVRGIRVLLELPHLKLRDETALRGVLGEIREALKTGWVPSEQALDEFAKAMRNSRLGGAHNRFYRCAGEGPEGTLSLDALIRTTAGEIRSAFNAAAARENLPERGPLLAQFAGHYPLEGGERARRIREIQRYATDDQPLLLTDAELAKFLDNGVLYHGTALANVPSILRGGLIQSNSEQGLALWGPGAYSSGKYQVAAGYGLGGAVLTLPVRTDVPVRAMTYERVLSLRPLWEECGGDREAVFKRLAEMGVDLVVIAGEHEVVIQNSAAIQPPKDVGALVDAYAARVEALAEQKGPARNAFREYCDLYRFAQLSAAPPVRSPDFFLPKLVGPLEEQGDVKGVLTFYRMAHKAGVTDLPLGRLAQRVVQEMERHRDEPAVLGSLLQTFREVRSLAEKCRVPGVEPLAMVRAKVVGQLGEVLERRQGAPWKQQKAALEALMGQLETEPTAKLPEAAVGTLRRLLEECESGRLSASEASIAAELYAAAFQRLEPAQQRQLLTPAALFEKEARRAVARVRSGEATDAGYETRRYARSYEALSPELRAGLTPPFEGA